ncbi:hypothetical protein AWM75_04890 [Aerococcus urinaehominis]|uniref:Diadenylate cyclase n=1 Tax=Aerococcus urinaehominis TaxID=128944 RepID=A0A109RGR5_9LACT|nr:diadenylate cyclase CdaA [Aerococcus urinaehominis]AMB99368.1 hypothetical protein AWM75_04890 [Aerococcus urinaehominis]SDM22600.1 diadenylate cyclase [Aerococcus urinaehominis]
MSFSWESLFTWSNLANLIDILLVWFIIYQLIKILRSSRAINIMNGVFIFLLGKLISSFFQLETIDWIMNNIIRWSVIAAIVIFQPEIRRGLEFIGKRFLINTSDNHYANPSEKMINEIVEACQYMAKRRIGALISLEKTQSLTDYAKTGIPLHANISSQLLINIFIPNTPLHDGAVIIQDLEISSAASYLPLSENPDIPKELGTRHRAAVGLSENTDAVTIVVSEETGDVSLTYHGKIDRELDRDELCSRLADHFLSKDDDDDDNFFVNLFAKSLGGDQDE